MRITVRPASKNESSKRLFRQPWAFDSHLSKTPSITLPHRCDSTEVSSHSMRIPRCPITASPLYVNSTVLNPFFRHEVFWKDSYFSLGREDNSSEGTEGGPRLKSLASPLARHQKSTSILKITNRLRNINLIPFRCFFQQPSRVTP